MIEYYIFPILFSTFYWFGQFGLYKLRNCYPLIRFRARVLIESGLFFQRAISVGTIAFIIIGIINISWYFPFVVLIIGFILNLIFSRVLLILKIIDGRKIKSKFEIIIHLFFILYSILVLLSLTYADNIFQKEISNITIGDMGIVSLAALPVFFLLILYFIPTFLAMGKENFFWIFLLNAAFGTTIVGYIIAIIWAQNNKYKKWDYDQ